MGERRKRRTWASKINKADLGIQKLGLRWLPGKFPLQQVPGAEEQISQLPRHGTGSSVVGAVVGGFVGGGGLNGLVGSRPEPDGAMRMS